MLGSVRRRGDFFFETKRRAQKKPILMQRSSERLQEARERLRSGFRGLHEVVSGAPIAPWWVFGRCGALNFEMGMATLDLESP